jgi:hypothetical protein
MKKHLILLCVLALAGCANDPDRDDSASKALQAQRSGYNEGYNDALRQQQAGQPQRGLSGRRLPPLAMPGATRQLPLPGLGQ